MYKISEIVAPNIFSSVVFMTTPMSNSCIIPHSSAAKILYVTRLYFIKDYCIIFL